MDTPIQNFRVKYPGYNDLDDSTLGNMLAKKYPDSYGDLATTIKPKEEVVKSPAVARQPGMVNEFTTQHQQDQEVVERQPPEVDDTPVPEWGVENPNLYGAYGAGKALIEKAVRPAVETAGTVGGGILGTSAGPAGTVSGSAMGYGASNQVMDLVEDYYAQLGGEKPEERTVGGEIKKVGTDVALVAATGAAFNYAPTAIKETGKVLFDKLPQRLVKSSLKMPSTAKWIKTTPTKDVNKQTATATEFIKSKGSITQEGLSKSKALTNEVHTFIDDATKILSKDPSNKLKFNKTISKGLKRAYKKASLDDNPAKAKALVDEIKVGLKQHGEAVTPHKANAIKRSLYNKTQWFIAEKTDPVVTTARKGVAREIAKSLEKMYPSIKPANETFAARMGVTEAIEKSLVRLGNTDIIPLPTKVLAAGAHPKLSALEYVMGRPRVKTQIAQWLSKANPKKYSQFIYPDKPVGYTPPVKKIEAQVYSDLIKIRSGKNQNIVNVAEGYSKFNIAKTKGPLGSDTISGIKDDVVKSIIPSMKTKLRPSEMKKLIKTKVAERIEKEEAIRAKHLEMQFRKQVSMEGSKGSPLATPQPVEYGSGKRSTPNIQTTVQTSQPISESINKWGTP